jgi:hypothetical protein
MKHEARLINAKESSYYHKENILCLHYKDQPVNVI